jgi:hypothetical protein
MGRSREGQTMTARISRFAIHIAAAIGRRHQLAFRQGAARQKNIAPTKARTHDRDEDGDSPPLCISTCVPSPKNPGFRRDDGMEAFARSLNYPDHIVHNATAVRHWRNGLNSGLTGQSSEP